MTSTTFTSLTKHQRDLLLEGLRYIRSSRRLSFREMSDPVDEGRENDLREIQGLMQLLDADSPNKPVGARS